MWKSPSVRKRSARVRAPEHYTVFSFRVESMQGSGDRGPSRTRGLPSEGQSYSPTTKANSSAAFHRSSFEMRWTVPVPIPSDLAELHALATARSAGCAELSRNGLHSDSLPPLFGQRAGVPYGCGMGRPYGGNYAQAPE